jgi:hypothetical protein
MPHSYARTSALYPDAENSPPAFFVHYTSAEAALNILKTKRLWMRSTTCMADYREVNYGHDMLMHAFHEKKLKNDFLAAFDKCRAGVAKSAIDYFDKNWTSIQLGTYVACLSEHDQKENVHGRLSMWRAFAPNTSRVALVVRVPSFADGVAEKLRLIFSPVGYFGQDGVCEELRAVIKNVEANMQVLNQLSPEILLGFIFTLFLAAVTCMKHDGFAEEKEWRVICCPAVLPDASGLIQPEVKTVAGVPQKIYELPLDVTRSPDLADVDLGKMLDHVIIGPSQYGFAMYEAFVDALTSLGVADAFKRVVVSEIPIRT